MRGAVMYGPGDVRLEDRPDPKIVNPTDAIIRITATCVCGSDLWSYRGIEPVEQPTPMGHEYAGIIEEVGSEVRNVRPGQFVIGSFMASDNTCPICLPGWLPEPVRARRVRRHRRRAGGVPACPARRRDTCRHPRPAG